LVCLLFFLLSPPLLSLSLSFFYFFEAWSHCITQVGLKLSDSRDPPTWSSQVLGLQGRTTMAQL
jgi:hypothetical protein